MRQQAQVEACIKKACSACEQALQAKSKKGGFRPLFLCSPDSEPTSLFDLLLEPLGRWLSPHQRQQPAGQRTLPVHIVMTGAVHTLHDLVALGTQHITQLLAGFAYACLTTASPFV